MTTLSCPLYGGFDFASDKAWRLSAENREVPLKVEPIAERLFVH
jgi:hypothetical protein